MKQAPSFVSTSDKGKEKNNGKNNGSGMLNFFSKSKDKKDVKPPEPEEVKKVKTEESVVNLNNKMFFSKPVEKASRTTTRSSNSKVEKGEGNKPGLVSNLTGLLISYPDNMSSSETTPRQRRVQQNALLQPQNRLLKCRNGKGPSYCLMKSRMNYRLNQLPAKNRARASNLTAVLQWIRKQNVKHVPSWTLTTVSPYSPCPFRILISLYRSSGKSFSCTLYGCK